MSADFVWRTNCLNLDLVNVSLTLLPVDKKFESLACINFVKSHLTVESFSDKSQDIDLVSQEILMTDTRFKSTNFYFEFRLFRKMIFE